MALERNSLKFMFVFVFVFWLGLWSGLAKGVGEEMTRPIMSTSCPSL